MAAGDRHNDGAGDSVRYEWQKWPPESMQGMPPKRRRLIGWGLAVFLLLGLASGLLDAAGLPQPWRTLLVLAGLAALFTWLIRAAVQETRQLRAEGVQLSGYRVGRGQLIVAAVMAAGLWALYVVVLILKPADGIALPVLPLAVTVWLIFVISADRRRRQADQG